MTTTDIEYLQGGREGSIKRAGRKVHRPAHPWTPTVHRFLRSLRENGCTSASIPYEINDQEEVVSYLDGDVYNEELPPHIQSDETLLSVAQLVKEYHEASIPFLDTLNGREQWMLVPREPVEVICHGDIAPYNVVMHGTTASGLIDFDTIHPGPRIWDLAYAVYRWVPLMAPENPESFGSRAEQLRRLRLFLEAYGAFSCHIKTVLETVIKRLTYLVTFMEDKAAAGDSQFQQSIEENHHLCFIHDCTYVQTLIESLDEELR